MKNIIYTLLAFIGFCTNCQAQDDISILSTQEYAKSISSDTSAVILDVRHSSEYVEKHLQGAILLDVLDNDGFETGIKGLDKSKTYYIYCRSGHRSHMAAIKMKAEGFHVAEMKGGIIAWEAEGLPVEK